MTKLSGDVYLQWYNRVMALGVCMCFFQWYNNALIIYSDARVKDALEYLEEKMKYWIETAVFNETDKTLKIFYESKLTHFHLIQ